MTILRSGMLCRLLAISFAMTVMVVMHQAQAAVGKAVIVKPVVIVSTASYNGSTSLLTVKGRYTAAGTHQPLEIVSNTGTLLASARTDSSRQFSFSLNVADKAQLCQVRVRIPGASFAKTIAAAPGTDCGLQPVCQITTPQSGVSVQAHQPVTFQASTLLKDNAARPLVLDWDFAGGSMGQDVSDAQELNRFVHPHTKSTSVSFDRDNSSYRVRFMARDKKGRYCEDSVDVLVGSPPVAPPAIASLAAESVKTAPQDASALNGKDGDLVVLPFPDYTMLANTDARFTPRIHAPMSYGPFNTLNAQVIRKGRLPAIQSGNDVSLTYRSSSNPDDPVGAGSINTTSQNYPVSADPQVPAPLMGSTIRKTDVWET
ncbi:MAG: hypothetical protein RIQ52_1995 [Pseudomonadota bacterium]